jgi:hypothetical protein
MNAYETLFYSIRSLTQEDMRDAKSFHDAIEKRLRAKCKTIYREYEVQDRGDGRRGFIDLVVLEPFRAAIELDLASPRKKSLFKLRQFSGERFVVLRKGLRIVRCLPK